MSDLTERLFDHRWDELSIPESKMLRNECGNHIEALEKAIAIYCRESGFDIEWKDDADAIGWFCQYADAVDKGVEAEFLAEPRVDPELQAFADAMGVDVNDPAFREIAAAVKNDQA